MKFEISSMRGKHDFFLLKIATNKLEQIDPACIISLSQNTNNRNFYDRTTKTKSSLLSSVLATLPSVRRSQKAYFFG